MDTQNLRDIRKLLGFTIAARTGREEDSREAIGAGVAAHIAADGAEGTAYLRVALREPREFRFFYPSAEFVPAAIGARRVADAGAGGTWFEPRLFTVDEPPTSTAGWPPTASATAGSIVPLRREPVEKPVKIVTAIIDALQAARGGAPRRARSGCRRWASRRRPTIWWRGCGASRGMSTTATTPGLSAAGGAGGPAPRAPPGRVLPGSVARQRVDRARRPSAARPTAVMTMVTTGALMYRPERVQFYCIAASGPQLARLADLPHVAAVVGR